MKKILKNKRGLSGVIAAVLLVALVIAAIAIIWVVVNNLVKENLDEAGSCVEIFDKVEINELYTCYTKTTGPSGNFKTNFSISVGDINLSKINVGISGEGVTKIIELSHEDNPNVVGSDGSKKIPGPNSGNTYEVNPFYFPNKPDKIEIVPYLNGNSCGVVDTLNVIRECN